MVPEGWEVIKLDNISEKVTSGSRNWAQYYSTKGSKFIRMTNLQRGSIYLNLDDLKYVDVETNSADGKRTSLEFGDILMSITAELGKIGWIHNGLGESYINQHTALIRINHKKAYSKYVAYLLSSKAMNHRINRLNDSGAKAGLNLTTIRSIAFSIPPLPEQQKIAKILSTWDKAIGTTERLIDNSIQQKKALMQQLLTGKKRLLDDEGQQFEGEWEEKTLTDAGITVTDGDRGKEYPNSSEFYDEGDYLFLSAKNVTKKGFLFEETQFISKEKYEKLGKGIVNRGDVVLTTRGTVGQTAYYDDSVQYDFLRVNSGMVTLDCNNSELESNFFYALTKSSLFKRQVDSLTFGSAQPQLTMKIIKSLKVPLPSIPEQQKIATVLTNADKEIELLEQQLADLQQEKKALMQVLLTGKKRVRVGG